jgi:hypothetical protein
MKLAAKPLAAVATLTLAASAMAADYSFKMPVAPDVPYAGVFGVAGPSFSDKLSFTAPVGAVALSGVVMPINIAPSWNISDIKIELFREGGVAPVVFAAQGLSPKIQDIGVIGGNDYYFKVTGNAAPAGSYTFAAVAAVAAIPEPETFVLMLGGVGLVGFVASRRRLS